MYILQYYYSLMPLSHYSFNLILPRRSSGLIRERRWVYPGSHFIASTATGSANSMSLIYIINNTANPALTTTPIFPGNHPTNLPKITIIIGYATNHIVHHLPHIHSHLNLSIEVTTYPSK